MGALKIEACPQTTQSLPSLAWHTISMSAFLVVITASGSEFDSCIRLSGLPHLKLPRGEYLIACEGNSDDLAKQLGLLRDEEGHPTTSAIVVEVFRGQFNGFFAKSYWDFLDSYCRDPPWGRYAREHY